MHQNLRLIQAGLDVKRSLVQAAAPSWAHHEGRPGCSELHPGRSRKPPRTETPQPPWALSPWGKNWNLSCSNLSVVFRLPSLHPCKKPSSIFLVISHRCWGAAVRSPWSCDFSRLNKPRSSASLHRASAPALIILMAFCWSSCSYWCFSWVGGGVRVCAKQDTTFQMWPHEYWVKGDNHCPQSPGCASVNIAPTWEIPPFVSATVAHGAGCLPLIDFLQAAVSSLATTGILKACVVLPSLFPLFVALWTVASCLDVPSWDIMWSADALLP